MIRIDYELSIERSGDSPSVGFLSIPAIVPGSCLDQVKLQGTRGYFYMVLAPLYTNKTALSTPSLLVPFDKENNMDEASWKQSLTQRLQHVRPSMAQLGDTVLNFTVMEAVSIAIPESGSSGSNNLPLGEWEAHAMRKYNVSSITKQTLLRFLGFQTLATTRVGSCKIPPLDVINLALQNETSRTYTLTDSTITKAFSTSSRGSVTIKPSLVSDPSLLLNSSSETLAKQILRQEQASNRGTSFTQAKYQALEQKCQELFKPYINTYIAPFPPLHGGGGGGGDSDDFRSTDANVSSNGPSHPLWFNSQNPQHVELSNAMPRMRPTFEFLRNMHAPLAKIDGDAPIPYHFYYSKAIVRESITDSKQGKYLSGVLDRLCKLYGYSSSEQLASDINTYLDHPEQHQQYCNVAILNASRVIASYLTHFNTTIRYRSDFALTEDGKIKSREDIARDILFGLNSDDCEGMDLITHGIYLITWYGPVDSSSSSSGRWNHRGLAAVQRFLRLYAPASLVGAATQSFPNASGNNDDLWRIPDLDAAQEEYRRNPGSDREDVRELRLMMQSDSSSSNTSKDGIICHRWSVMIPLDEWHVMFGGCYQLEESIGCARNATDSSLMNRMLGFLSAASRNMPRLPKLLLESTVPTNGFAIFGASNYLSPEDRPALEAQERTNRRQMYDMKVGGLVDKWFEQGIVRCDEGIYQILPGEVDLKRRSSSFYRAISCANFPTLAAQVNNGRDFNCAFLSSSSSSGEAEPTFGISIEDLFTTDFRQLVATQSPVLVTMSLHRLPLSMRNEADSLGERISKWYIPSQLCMNEPVVAATGSSSSSSNQLSPFALTMFAINQNVASLADENALKASYRTLVASITERLQPYGPDVELITVIK